MINKSNDRNFFKSCPINPCCLPSSIKVTTLLVKFFKYRVIIAPDVIPSVSVSANIAIFSSFCNAFSTLKNALSIFFKLSNGNKSSSVGLKNRSGLSICLCAIIVSNISCSYIPLQSFRIL